MRRMRRESREDAGERGAGMLAGGENREMMGDENGAEGLQEVEKRKDTNLAGEGGGVGPVKWWDEEKGGLGEKLGGR